MKQTDFNYLKMTGVVISGMDKNTDKWSAETEVSDACTSVKDDYNLIISKNDMVVGLETTGMTAAKDVTLENISRSTFKICKAMSAYAKSRGDLVLQAKADIAFSSLSRGPELEVIARCSSMLDLATENLSKLSGHKITAEKIETIRQLFTVYGKHTGDRGTTRSSKTVGNSELESQMSALRKKMDILDDNMEALIDDETFLSEYKSWRMVIDYGKGKTLKNKTEKTDSNPTEKTVTEAKTEE